MKQLKIERGLLFIFTAWFGIWEWIILWSNISENQKLLLFICLFIIGLLIRSQYLNSK